MEPPCIEVQQAVASDPGVPEDAAPDAASRSAAAKTRRRRRLAAGGAGAPPAGTGCGGPVPASRAPGTHRAGNGLLPGETTAPLARRTLTESSTVDGTLGYGSTFDLYDRVSGTFTWLPVVGAVIGRGGTLWRVNNEPIALMYGSVPAYRTLKEGVSAGPDVTELNENLVDLGYDPYGAIAEDEDFS